MRTPKRARVESHGANEVTPSRASIFEAYDGQGAPRQKRPNPGYMLLAEAILEEDTPTDAAGYG